MSKPLVAVTTLFLLIFAGGSFGLAETAARRIPWDCSNWAAYSHENRTTAILETLAENRGQTLYCGIDQSNTFTKAETWEAGKDRNERDDTIYWGERGNFRGFIAAQEGCLTDGESGITGQSTAAIFEFPREKRKRRRYRTITERHEIPPDTFYSQTPLGPAGSSATNLNQGRLNAQSAYDANPPSGWNRAQTAQYSASWRTLVARDAKAYCIDLGYQRAVDVADNSALEDWNYSANQGSGGNYIYQARRYRYWTATCERKVRRRR